jgi:hypothetical protein
MQAAKQSATSRANAQNPTGPHSATAASRYNTLQHGIFDFLRSCSTKPPKVSPVAPPIPVSASSSMARSQQMAPPPHESGAGPCPADPAIQSRAPLGNPTAAPPPNHPEPRNPNIPNPVPRIWVRSVKIRNPTRTHPLHASAIPPAALIMVRKVKIPNEPNPISEHSPASGATNLSAVEARPSRRQNRGPRLPGIQCLSR